MADISAIEAILAEIEKSEGVEDAVLVSRSGMHIAGEVPAGAHSETFVAMFAILLGAAETATSELKERLDSVVINLEGSRVLILNDGPKALFVLRTTKDVDPRRVRQSLEKYAKRIEDFL
ncbi:MAG TPA: roadblock/LC7 domain-containing protein [Thermoplasmata archaeon]|nr:roadblock/LC7 domain-containing protein [Thermoplasmata archaeon]